MQITLRNIKKIKELNFKIPPQGTWVLTGLNGSGKTSLFASIYRIGAQHAFQKFYKTSPLENKLDSYESAEIEYTIKGESVRYHYGGQRWRATPRRHANLFEQSPYSAIEYIEASGNRIEPFAEEIKPRRLKPAPEEIRLFLKNVLGNEKWEDLKFVNTRRGVGNDAYLIPYQVNGKTYYYSEKSFSLGELCALKLARKICSVPEKSLLLIDEVEMALHPQAQVRLLNEVTRIARQKSLTILFSTHSATIIKNVSRKNLIHLKQDEEGRISTISGAFPAQILGDIAFDDELAADFIFYVEDKQAKLLAEQLFGMYMAACHENLSYRPLYKIAPVGGFVQVIEMLNSSSSIFPKNVKRFALLDQDVKTESLREARQQQNTALLDLFTTAEKRTLFLPCTPEVGLIDLIETQATHNTELTNRINQLLTGHRINIKSITTTTEYLQLTKTNPRDQAKSRLNHIITNISRLTDLDELHIRRAMYSEYCNFHYSGNIGKLRQFLGPVFNAM